MFKTISRAVVSVLFIAGASAVAPSAVAQQGSAQAALGSATFISGVYPLGSIGTVDRRFTIPVTIANPANAVVSVTLQTADFGTPDTWTYHIGAVTVKGIEVRVRRTDAGQPGGARLAFHYIVISTDAHPKTRSLKRNNKKGKESCESDDCE